MDGEVSYPHPGHLLGYSIENTHLMICFSSASEVIRHTCAIQIRLLLLLLLFRRLLNLSRRIYRPIV